MTDSIPVNSFAARLWRLVETKSYTDNNFWIDNGYPDMVRIGFGNLGQGVMYQCLPHENYKEIISNLQSICKKIISNIINELSNYNEAKENLNKVIQDLLNELDKVQYSHQLRFENIDDLKCRYIKL
jgi:hypothetical protein